MRLALVLTIPSLAAAFPTAASVFRAKRADTWGGAVSLGPTKSTIKNAVTTIIPGAAPETQAGELFLWPGMSNSSGDLIQTTLEQWSTGNDWCGAGEQEWCVRASVFGSFGQLDANSSAVSGDMKVRIEYNLMADGTTWEQIVTDADTGANLSYFTHDSGPYMTGYGTGTECDDSCTGTISEQKYINTTITLASADTSFADTIGTSGGASYTGLSMSTDGTVLTIEEMLVPAMS